MSDSIDNPKFSNVPSAESIGSQSLIACFDSAPSGNQKQEMKLVTVESLLSVGGGGDGGDGGGGGGSGGSGDTGFFSINGMWLTSRVEPSGETVTLNVLGGFATIQGETFAVDGVNGLAGALNGFVCLKVTRDASSRQSDTEEPPVIVWVNTEPVNHDSEPVEYYILAQVISGVVLQHRYEEIIAMETMIVVHGETKLTVLPMLVRDTYSLPI